MPQHAKEAVHDIIVVGTSAGGVEALLALAGALPGDFPASIFVVLHVPPRSTSVLPRILERGGLLPAAHAADGEPVVPGRLYIAPPDQHMLLEPGQVRVVPGPRENGHRPAVDPLFRSAAAAYGPRVAGVILTGSGDDGTAGLIAVKRHGGLVVVQDPDTAFSASMPRSATRFVEPDYVLPLAEIGPLLVRVARGGVGGTSVDEEASPSSRRTTGWTPAGWPRPPSFPASPVPTAEGVCGS